MDLNDSNASAEAIVESLSSTPAKKFLDDWLELDR